ncbi:MAG: ATP-binding protein [Planctomycetota bacterium]|nr:ATP-binding protein [Planctomycetota bacterium]MEC9046840.1 ATP-binding protein [Planctomycetota bacterium]
MVNQEREERLSRIRMQRLAQLGTLLAGFAHEVRNPLSTIGLNLQLVLEDFRDAETARDKRTNKRLSTVEAEVRRLQSILESFLSFARAPEPNLVDVDLNQRLRKLVDLHDLEMKEAEVSLRFYPGADVGEVACDWDHVQGAVGNLLRNAKDATPPGGEILVSTRRDQDHVTVRVTDTGEGIPADQAARVLEPYFSTKKGGTGLGLPTARRVAEEHGGTLTLQSEPGKGTQFMLRLPVRGVDQVREKP